MSAQNVLKLREQLSKLKSERSRKEGMLESVWDRLTTEFGVSNKSTAEDLLKDMKEKKVGLEEELTATLEKINEKYGDRLNAIGR